MVEHWLVIYSIEGHENRMGVISALFHFQRNIGHSWHIAHFAQQFQHLEPHITLVLVINQQLFQVSQKCRQLIFEEFLDLFMVEQNE